MEKNTKRIIAIVLVVVLAVGIGGGVYILFLAPGAEDFVWSSSNAPGAPAGISSDQIIKIGVAGDIGEIQGDAAWEGSYLAAKHINEAGGLDINGTTYYIGVTYEDTDEVNPNFITSRGIAAAERLVYNKKIQLSLGGFRSESLLAYQEVFMDNKIPFINTGAATDIFCQNVMGFYDHYKYFFRINPINSTALGTQILYFLANHIIALNATYPHFNNSIKIGILAEDLTWTTPNIEAIVGMLPAVTGLFSAGAITVDIVKTILYDITLTSGDMATHLNTLEAAGCDIVIPLISAQGGIMMMTQYADLKPEYLIIGIDVQAQLDTFWSDSGGTCIYETLLQIGYNTSKTAESIPFWNAYYEEWGHEPLYIASGSYDAVDTFVWAINESQSLNTDIIVATMENITKANYLVGVGGNIAFWPTSHEIVAGYPYGYALFCQWQANETKVVVSSYNFVYPDALKTGNYTVTPWVHTAWS
jgi:ABC-type branched-subunit amino acid transport system substrate-binding protein